jgi:hypothetical protein
MYSGAMLEVLALIIALLTNSSLKSATWTRHPTYTAAQLHTAEMTRAIPVAVGLVAIVLIFSKDSGPFYNQQPVLG